MFKKLKYKITFTFVLVATLIIFFMGYSLFYIAGMVIGNLSDGLNTEIVDSYSNNIESLLNRKISEVQIIANSKDVANMNPAESTAFLKKVHDSSDFGTLSIVFPDGTAYDSNMNQHDFSSSAYMKPIFEDGEDYYITDPFPSSVDGRLLVVFAHSIKDSNQNTIGAISGSMYLDDIVLTLQDISIEGAGFGWLMSNEGDVLIHHDEELIGSNLSTISHYNNINVDKISNSRLGVEHISIDSVPSVILYSSIEDSPGWYLMIEVTLGDLLAGLTTFRNIVILTVLGSVIVSIIASILIANNISRPITFITKIIERFSNYDFSLIDSKEEKKYSNRKDEIGTMLLSLEKMQNNVIELLDQIFESSNEVYSSSELLNSTTNESSKASNEVAKTIEDMASSASEQALNTENGADNINLLGTTIENNQEYLSSLNKEIESVYTYQKTGNESMDSLINITKENIKATNEIKEVIKDTSINAEKIEKASEMIKNISEQTNLLALNAAIEAARAGESGKGFAVVAEEIRKLAEQSNSFTDEISKIINELLNKVNESVNTMESVEKIAASQENQVNITNENFLNIKKSLDQMKSKVEELNTSGKDMEEKKNEIIKIISNLSAISEENAAGTQEASASVEEQTAALQEIANSSEQLSELANNMNKALKKFKTK